MMENRNYFTFLVTSFIIFSNYLSAQNYATTQAYYGYPGVHLDVGRDIARTPDAGFVIAGNWGDSAFVMKFDCHGDSLWLQFFHKGTDASGFGGIVALPNGELVVGGFCHDCIAGDVTQKTWVVRTDNQGNMIQDSVFGLANKDVNSNDIEVTNDGGYILTGQTNRGGLYGSSNHLIKLDSSFSLEWIEYYDGSFFDNAYGVTPTDDGGYALIGTSSIFNGPKGIHVFRTDSLGDMLWHRKINGPAPISGNTGGHDIITDDSGNLVLTGDLYLDSFRKQDLVVMRLDDSTGISLDSVHYGSSGNEDGISIVANPAGGFMVAGVWGTQLDTVNGYPGWVLLLNDDLDSISDYKYDYFLFSSLLKAVLPLGDSGSPESFVATGVRAFFGAADVEFIMQKVQAEFDTLNAVCVNNASFTLSGGSPSGGIYSGTGVSNGVFDPTIAGVGAHTLIYTYTDSFGCVFIASQNIQVNPLPNVNFGSINDACENDSPFTLSTATPSGGIYSGPGVSGSIFNPTTAGIGTHNIIYTYTDSNGCVSNASQTLIVNPNPVVSIGTLTDICANEPPLSLSGGSPSGGNYSGPGVGGNIFNAGVAGAGIHTITYTYIDTIGCSSNANTNIIVLPAPSVSFPALQPVCEGSPSFALSGGSPVGGVYSGTGANNGVFDPIAAGLGIHMINYMFTNAEGCTDSVVQAQEVVAIPTVTLNQIVDVCEEEPPFMLSFGNPAGGVYSGIGVDNGIFDPSLAGSGIHAITYILSVANNCTDSATGLLEVLAPPAITSIMNNGDTLSVAGSGSFQWFLNGNLIEGATDSIYLADSSGNYQVQITDMNGCKSPLSDIFNHIATDLESFEEVGIHILIYPNPAQSFVILDIDGLKGHKSFKIEIFTINGQSIYKDRPVILGDNYEGKISIKNLAKGAYFLKIHIDDGLVFTDKIIRI